MGVVTDLIKHLATTSDAEDVHNAAGQCRAPWTAVQGSRPLRPESVLAARALGIFSLVSPGDEAMMRLKCLTGSSQLAMCPHG